MSDALCSEVGVVRGIVTLQASDLRKLRSVCGAIGSCAVMFCAATVYASACTDLCDQAGGLAQTLILMNAQAQQDDITFAYNVAFALCSGNVDCENAAALVANIASEALRVVVAAAMAAVDVAHDACVALCGS